MYEIEYKYLNNIKSFKKLYCYIHDDNDNDYINKSLLIHSLKLENISISNIFINDTSYNIVLTLINIASKTLFSENYLHKLFNSIKKSTIECSIDKLVNVSDMNYGDNSILYLFDLVNDKYTNVYKNKSSFNKYSIHINDYSITNQYSNILHSLVSKSDNVNNSHYSIKN